MLGVIFHRQFSAYQNLPTKGYHLTPEVHQRKPLDLTNFQCSVLIIRSKKEHSSDYLFSDLRAIHTTPHHTTPHSTTNQRHHTTKKKDTHVHAHVKVHVLVYVCVRVCAFVVYLYIYIYIYINIYIYITRKNLVWNTYLP